MPAPFGSSGAPARPGATGAHAGGEPARPPSAAGLAVAHEPSTAAERLNYWLATHRLVVAGVLTAWMALAAWHLYVPASLVTANGHLIDPSTTDPAGYNVVAYRNFAYSDIYRLYAERGLWSHPAPYFQARIEYPVLTGVFMWVASFAHGVQADFVVSAVGLWIAALASLYALSRVLPRTWHWFAFTPLLFVYSLLNWDLLGICAMAAGVVLLARRRFDAAAVALSLGMCAKLFPVVYVPFVVAALVRDHGLRSRPPWRFLAVFAAVALAVNLPFAIGAFHNWTFFLSFNASRGGSTGVLPVLSGHVGAEDALIGAAVLLAAVLGVRAVLRGSPVEQVAVLTFVVFLELNKVYSPQYTLWLVVMAMLAGWPGWSLGLLSVVGLADYFGTFATLYATNASVGHGALTTWWSSSVAPWVGRVRYTALAAAALASLLVARTAAIDLLGGRRAGRQVEPLAAAVAPGRSA